MFRAGIARVIQPCAAKYIEAREGKLVGRLVVLVAASSNNSRLGLGGTIGGNDEVMQPILSVNGGAKVFSDNRNAAPHLTQRSFQG